MKRLFLFTLILVLPYISFSQCYNGDFDIMNPGNGMPCYQTGIDSYEVRYCPFNYGSYAIVARNPNLTIKDPGGIVNPLSGYYTLNAPGTFEITNTETNATYTVNFIPDYEQPANSVEWVDENYTTMTTLSYCKKESYLPLSIRVNGYCIYGQNNSTFDLKINGQLVDQSNYIEIKDGNAYLITDKLKNGDKLQLFIKDLLTFMGACPTCISPYVYKETQEVTLQLIDNETLPTPTVSDAPFCAGDTAILMRESSLTDVYFVNLGTQSEKATCTILNPQKTRLLSKNKRSNGCYAVSDEVEIAAKDCGYKVIRGYVYEDLNSNYKYDADIDRVFSNVKVRLDGGTDYAFSNNKGIYEFKSDKLKADISYRVSIADPEYSNATNTNYFSSAVGSHYLDLSLRTFKLLNSDLALQASSGRNRPGFTIPLYFNIYNQGKINNSGSLSITLDKAYTYNSASIEPKEINGQSLSFDLSNLSSGQTQTIIVYAKLSTNSALGDSLTTQANIVTTVTDLNTVNNAYTMKNIVVGSFDPNDIEVNPKGQGSEGAITKTEELDYTIRFQNMGTDTAFTVVVKNKLPQGVDFSKFEMKSASHPFQLSLQGGDTIVWTFNNILLPDNKVNEPESHGLIKYHIAQKANNPIGTEIRNEAEIYFDYNKPVATNQVLNTINDFLITGINSPANYIELVLYPNPSNGSLSIATQESGNFILTSTTGEIILTSQVNNGQQQNFTGLPKGFYLYTFQTSNGKKTGKLTVN